MISTPAGSRSRFPSRLPGTLANLGCFVVAIAITGLALRHTGVSVAETATMFAVVCSTIYWPGWALARLTSPFRGVELFGAAFVLGLVPQLLGWALATSSGFAPFLWLVPVLVGLAGTHLVRRGDGAQRAPHVASSVGTAIAVPTLLLLAWLLTLRSIVKDFWRSTSSQNPTNWYPDLYWHMSLSSEAQHHVPLRDPQSLADGTLSYHWFANAYSAALASTSHASLVNVTVVWWVLPVALSTVALVYSLTRTLSGSRVAAGCAPILMALGPLTLVGKPFDFGASSSFVWLSPSHVFSLPVALLLVVGVVQLLRTPAVSKRQVVFMTFVVVLAPGTKVSILPVVLAGLALALVVSLWVRGRTRRLFWLATGMGLVLVGTSPLFAGGGGGSTLQVGSTVRQSSTWMAHHATYGSAPWLPLLGLMSLFALNYAWMLVPSVALLARAKSDLVPLFGLGMWFAGLGAMLVLRHPSLSQVYFMRGLLPVLCAFACWGLVQAVRSSQSVSHRLAMAGFCGLSGVALGLWWPTTRIFRHAADTRTWEALGIVVVILGLAGGAWAIRRPSAATKVAATIMSWAVVGAAVAQPLSALVEKPLPGAPPATPATASPLNWAQVDGAEHLHELNPDGALIATNVHCLGKHEVSQCDERGFWVAGLGQSPALIGAWGYSTSARTRNNWHGIVYTHVPYVNEALFALNQRAFREPNPKDLATLRGKGVRYLFADRSATPVSGALDELTRKRYDNGEVAIYQLTQ